MQGSRLAGDDMAAAPAFHLLDVAGAAESEGPADHVIVVKSQQTQQLTKDLVKAIAAHGFSALCKLRATPVFPAGVDRSPTGGRMPNGA